MNYKRIYDSIIERAKERLVPEGYVEHHHIIPRCMGGEDTKENIVALTPEEHFLCHILLVKIYPEHSGLIYAVGKMCRGHKGKRKRRKLYGWLKRKFSEQRKNDTAGNKNPQYGTMWINKIGTVENKKINKNDQIPEGWQKGRKFKINDYTIKECKYCKNAFKVNTKELYCSDDCKISNNNPLYERRIEFLEKYEKCGNMNKTLKNMGFVGAFGGVYDTAKLILERRDK